MLDHVLVDLISAIRQSLDDALLQRQAVEERFQVDVFLGDVSWETSYSLPGEEQPPRVRADISVDWPTWSQTAYRSWSIGESPDELPEVVIEVALRIQRLAEAPPTGAVLAAMPARSPLLVGGTSAGASSGAASGGAGAASGGGRRRARPRDPLAELAELADLEGLEALEALDALGGLEASADADSEIDPPELHRSGGIDPLQALDPLGRLDDDPLDGRLVRTSTTIEQAHNFDDELRDADLPGGGTGGEGGPAESDGGPGGGSGAGTVRWAVEATYEGSLRFDEEHLENPATLAPIAGQLARWLASTLVQLADLPLRFVPADPLEDG